MKENLEKSVKGCLKRKVNVTLALLAVFAITGMTSFATSSSSEKEELKTDYGIRSFLLGFRTADAFNETNGRVNENTKTIEAVKTNAEVNSKLIEGISGKVNKNRAEIQKMDGEIKKEKIERVAENKKLADKISDNEFALKMLKGNKADKAETEKNINDLKEGLNNEVRDRKNNEKKLLRYTKKNEEAIKKERTARVVADTAHDKAIKANTDAISTETAARVAGDVKHDRAIAANRAAIEYLDKKSSEGIAAVSAMSVLDFNDAPVGRVGVGAAVGGYRNKQAVAVGIVYGVSEDFKVNSKIGFSTDDIKNAAYGVSGTYYFQ